MLRNLQTIWCTPPIHPYFYYFPLDFLILHPKPILHHHVYIFVCLGLCVLFYIVIGIQFWATEYFVKFTGASPGQAMINFSILAITAPITGAILGGKISDHLVT